MLTVKPNRTRYWSLRVMHEGRRRDLGLGNAGKGGVGLADARVRAAELRRLVKDGGDPVAAKRQAIVDRRAARVAATERTFEAVARRFLKGHTPSLKSPRHAALWRSTLETYAFPAFGDQPIDGITGPMVIDALELVWTRAPETARRVRQRVAAVLDYAYARGWRGPKPDLAVLTAKALPKQAAGNHHAAVGYTAAPVAVAALWKAPESIGRLALLFTIHTAARSGETRGAKWGEIDFGASTWTVPAERMKGAKTHVVPLSASALAILGIVAKARTRHEPDELIFPGNGLRPLSDMTLNAAQRTLVPDVTVHGWRSTFRDWAGETTEFATDVCEAALAHVVGGKVQRAYQRGDLLGKRRALMDAWAAYLAGDGA